MQSKQEELAKLFCELATGAPFVFVPEKYGKARGQREPADLVWACNGCVVLIYLCRKRTIQKAQEHNIAQAKGWLRAWRNLGQVLRGRNRYGEIAISANDSEYPHVVILSVIECEGTVAEYHHRETVALGVTMYATVPISAIRDWSLRRASMLDILQNIEWLRRECIGPLAEERFLGAINGYCRAAWRDSGADKLWPPYVIHPQRLAVDRFMHNLRALELPHFTSSPKLFGGPSAPSEWTPQFIADLVPTARWFADLTLLDALTVMRGIKTMLDSFEARLADPVRQPDTTQVFYQHIPLWHYDLTLHAIDSTRPPPPEKDVDTLMDFKKKHDRRGSEWGGPSITFFILPPATFVNAAPLVPPQSAPSATELFLDGCRAAQYASSD